MKLLASFVITPYEVLTVGSKGHQRDSPRLQTAHNCLNCYKCHITWCVQVLRSPKEAFAAAMQSWRERCEKCVCLQGDYVEK